MINFGFRFEDFRGAEFSKNSWLMRDLQMFPSAPSIYCFIEQNRVVKKNILTDVFWKEEMKSSV